MPLKQQNMVGISPGVRKLKMVQSNGKGQIVRAVLSDMPEGVINQMKVEAPELLASAVKTAAKAGGMRGGACTLCLSGSGIIIRHLTFPYMNDSQLYHNILSEISGYLPVDPEKFSIDYQVQEAVENGDTTQIKVMVVAIQKEIIESYVSALKLAGFKVVTIDIADNAREKLLRYASQKSASSDAHFCVIDFGAGSTSISAYNEGRFFVNKIVNAGGQSLTEIIAQNRQVDMLSAETIKAESDFLYGDDDPKSQTAITAQVDQWIYEASRVIDYFYSRNNQVKIQSVYICGGGSRLKGLERYFQEHLGLPVKDFEPIVASFVTKKTKSIEAPFFADAIGCTFREVVK